MFNLILIMCGLCFKFTRRKQGNITTHIFKSILPWTEYSATVCCAFHQSEIHPKSIGNEFNCTCGDPLYIIPAGPVSIKTQPKGIANNNYVVYNA